MNNSIYHADIKALANNSSSEEKLDQPDHEITVDNPLCGDRVRIALKLENGRITKEAHQVKGCMLCRASANAIGASVIGISASELESVAMALKAMLQGQAADSWPLSGWESLDLFQPVASHKSRHDCVMLPFKAVAQALMSAPDNGGGG